MWILNFITGVSTVCSPDQRTVVAEAVAVAAGTVGFYGGVPNYTEILLQNSEPTLKTSRYLLLHKYQRCAPQINGPK